MPPEVVLRRRTERQHETDAGPVPTRPLADPEHPAMRVHDGSRDGEAHPETVGLRREERLEHSIGQLRGDTGSIVSDSHLDLPVRGEPALARDLPTIPAPDD